VRPEVNPYPGSRSAPLYAAPWSVSRRPVGPDDPPGQPKIDSGPRETVPAPRPFHPAPAGPPSRWQAPVVALLALLLSVPIGLILLWRKRSWTRGARWAVGLVAVAAAITATVTLASPGGRPARVTAATAPTSQVASLTFEAGSSMSQAAPLTGSATTGSTATGSTATGSTPTGSTPTGSESGSLSPTPPTVVRDAQPSGIELAVAQLASLRIAARSYAKPYQRAQFGQAWADVDHNGCDTRNDILRRDLAAVTFKPGTNGCVVSTGTLRDPYSGAVLNVVRGGRVRVEIDHVVSLADAWHTGAFSWTAAQRLAFANDPLELLAVSADLNQAKKDADAASWLPPSTGRRCTFVARQVAIKVKFQLWVTPAEHDAIARVLRTCGAPPPTKAAAKAAAGAIRLAPHATPAPRPVPRKPWERARPR